MKNRGEIRVVLADDHALVRRGFRRLLDDEPDITVVGEAGTGLEAVKLVGDLKPDIVVMDVSMPEMDGLEATRRIRARHPRVRVLVLSMHANETYIRNAEDSGASGYLLKNALDVDLAAALRRVAGGEYFVTNARPRQDEDDDEVFQQLTPRERQVLQLIAQGKSAKDIANILQVSVNTVAVHRQNLMDRLNLHKAAELTLYAMRKGLVIPP